ncbi:MAG: hypothetical protein M1536_06045 [Firmicutes bacterium]|nr:hypothetical protein [Bacillota bacterium]
MMKKKITGYVAVVVCLFLVGLWCSHAIGEEKLSNHAFIDEYSTTNYNVYVYPSSKEVVLLPAKTELKLEIHNGSYFMLNYEYFGEEEIPIFAAEFYSAKGEYLGKVENIRQNFAYSIPRRGHNEERIYVKFINESGVNKELRCFVYDPLSASYGIPFYPAHWDSGASGARY